MRGSARVVVERTGEVTLRRTTRGAGAAVVGRAGDLDEEVAAAGELLEVVARDVGVEVEVLGDRARGDAAGRLAHEEVDLTPGGIAEGVGDRADDGVELVGAQAFLDGHAGYSTYLRSGNLLPQELVDGGGRSRRPGRPCPGSRNPSCGGR